MKFNFCLVWVPLGCVENFFVGYFVLIRLQSSSIVFWECCVCYMCGLHECLWDIRINMQMVNLYFHLIARSLQKFYLQMYDIIKTAITQLIWVLLGFSFDYAILIGYCIPIMALMMIVWNTFRSLVLYLLAVM